MTRVRCNGLADIFKPDISDGILDIVEAILDMPVSTGTERGMIHHSLPDAKGSTTTFCTGGALYWGSIGW
jgi:hypothetical protein